MKISKCDAKQWDAFVEKSPQGIVFCQTYFLQCYDKNVTYLLCHKGKEVVAGTAFVDSGEAIDVMPYQPYGGIIIKDLSGLNDYRRNYLVYCILEKFASYLFDNYSQVRMNFHWDILDMRPFIWFNYHDREKGYFKVSARYTSLLNISNPKDTSGYQVLRRRSLKASEKANCCTIETDNVDVLNRLHEKTFNRQGIRRSEEEGVYLTNICKHLIKLKKGHLFITKAESKPASGSFFLVDSFRAYYLFGATDPKLRGYESGTKNLYDAFCYLNSENGCEEIDFVGVNSPQRGAYKLSFGGKLVPYFLVEKVHGKN